MARTLKVVFPKKCIGCEICVLEAQRQLGKVGLEGSPIRIFRNKSEKGVLSFIIDVDPSAGDLDLEKIRLICPLGVFVIEGTGEGSDIGS